MNITGITGMMDGGTIKIFTSTEIYCIDSRIKTKTRGVVYDEYPKDDNSNILPNQQLLRYKLLEAIENYPGAEFNWNWRPAICKLLNENFHD
tara:strand:- start:133 stop:408 length:276 start_codon:yes stop_codon:yes gene_type:complete